MKFKVLQDNLRKALWSRIGEGELTGLRLAELTGFRQAHISNFLNRKRGLSIEGMDKVLSVQHLSVLDLLDHNEINKRASLAPPSNDEFDNVLLVDGRVAATKSRIMNMHVRETLKCKRSFLNKLRPEPEGDRHSWVRFVALKVDSRAAASMSPRLAPGANVIIDRHYNSLKPYRKGEANLYAVAQNGGCTVTYVEQAGRNLLLRPHNQSHPVEVLALAEGAKAADHIIGRVCFVSMEA
jgi:hypothetical protein